MPNISDPSEELPRYPQQYNNPGQPPIQRTALQRQRSLEAVGKPFRTEIPIPPEERPRPSGFLLNKNSVGTINPNGVFGDLDDIGLDWLAGFIARSNGIQYHGTQANRLKNPGGFGFSFKPHKGLSPVIYIPPTHFKESYMPWMIPWRDALVNNTEVKGLEFASWSAGGQALIDYMKAIRKEHILAFPRGPNTLIGDFIDHFDFIAEVTGNFPWSWILDYLEKYDLQVAADAFTLTN